MLQLLDTVVSETPSLIIDIFPFNSYWALSPPECQVHNWTRTQVVIHSFPSIGCEPHTGDVEKSDVHGMTLGLEKRQKTS